MASVPLGVAKQGCDGRGHAGGAPDGGRQASDSTGLEPGLLQARPERGDALKKAALKRGRDLAVTLEEDAASKKRRMESSGFLKLYYNAKDEGDMGPFAFNASCYFCSAVFCQGFRRGRGFGSGCWLPLGSAMGPGCAC